MTTKGDSTDGTPADQESGEARFLVDGTAGRLARWLRLLGFDTAYSAEPAGYHAVHRARAEGRILLTRRRAASELPWASAVFLDSEILERQLAQLASLYRLPAKPLTRCSDCNTPLQEASRDSVQDKVPPYVFRTAPAFSVCPECGHVYWQGTHYKRIAERWRELRRLSAGE
jgi:uncharacterized protein with PIN domain